MFRRENHDLDGSANLTAAEVSGVCLVSFLAFAILFAYFADWSGLAIAPVAVLGAACALTIGLFASLRPGMTLHAGELAVFGGIVIGTLVWLLRLSWPDYLLPGGGADLTHHLQLVDYLDRHWRLIHEPAVEAYLGEMVHYTPGAHLLASLAGSWAGTDGFHAIFPIVALSVALKAGFVFLVAQRVLRVQGWESTAPFAVVAVVLLLLPWAFFVGSFARYSYIAQVVSEMFAVMMWWALVAWDERPSLATMLLFAIAGAAVFLTWPIWVGPPLVALAAAVLVRRDVSLSARIRTLTLGVLPIAAVAAAFTLGRLAWARMARTDANMAVPFLGDFNWWFLGLSGAGVVALGRTRAGRTSGLLLAACAVQAAALFVAAKTGGAKVPYMAIKMAYFAIYPLAVGSGLALAGVWRGIPEVPRLPRASRWLSWALAALIVGAIGWRAPQMSGQKPTVSGSLYSAGRWARDNVEPTCVEYIVGDDDTAYWLHLAVLGNRRMSARTADDSTFVARDAIVRWINPGGLPFAVADLEIIPRDVLEGSDELARFGSAVVIKRRGPAECAKSVDSQ